VFIASWSGGTEDTLAALRRAKEAGARTVALVRSADSPIGREADVCVAYESTALYALPMAAVTLFALEWARLEGNRAADAITQGIGLLPELIDASYTRDQARGEALAREYLPSQVLYCVGAGPLYGLAYKFALTVFMENIRTHGSIIESAEKGFRVMRCDHSLRGGEWLASTRHRLAEPIYGVFVMLEAVRLIEVPAKVADKEANALVM